MKRIIAMLLAIVMLVGNVPVQAFAAEGQPEPAACATEGCTYAAGHQGNCSNYVESEEPDRTAVSCGTTGCEYGADHAGHCSNYVEPAADAAVYVTVSNRGDLGMAHEEITVSDINQDGRLSVDEALYAAHTVSGKGYASENGTVTKLWDVETTNVSFFVNHEPISTDVSADTIRDGDYLVASVDRDTVNDYDKYSRFHTIEKQVDGGREFTLTLVDNDGTALSGMEIGLWDGSGSTTMLGRYTDENGQVTLTLDREGTYCVTAKGTLVEQSYNLETETFTSIETPIIAPVCVVTVTGTAVPESVAVYSERVTTEVRSPAAFAAAVGAGTELIVSGNVITLAAGTYVNNDSRCPISTLTLTADPAVTVSSAVQNGFTVDLVLEGGTDPAASITAVLTPEASNYRFEHTNNTCTLANGVGTMTLLTDVYSGMMPYPVIKDWAFTVNISTPVGEACKVTVPTGDGIVFSGKETAYKDSAYPFAVSVSEGYDGTNMVVKVNGEAVTGDNGSYTVPSVSGDLIITVEGVVKKELCSVALTEGDGYTISSTDIPYKGEDYTFTVTADETNYKIGTLKVLDGETELTGENGTYTIPALAEDHVITVSIEKKAAYTVTWNTMEGVVVTGADRVLETDPYTFTITIDNAYDASGMVVTVNEEEITLQEDGSYTIGAVSGDIIVNIAGVAKKAVYTVTLVKGEGYTISGQETSYAGEPYTFTVTVDDAIYWADRIQVTVNEQPVTLTEGTHTIEALAEDTTVAVSNIVERKLFTVTKPEVAGVAVTGAETVREGKPYTFSVTIEDGYDCSAMAVSVNGQPVSLTDGSYTIESAGEDIVIAVTGVEAKVICSITLPTGKGYTASGALTAYQGDSYTFTLKTTTGYTDTNMVVTVNGEAVTGTDGSYTFTVSGDTVIEVTGVERAPVTGTKLNLTNNHIDITDRSMKPFGSYAGTVTEIQIDGATVTEAYEDGTTVTILLSSATADGTEIGVAFSYSVSNSNVTMKNVTGSAILTDDIVELTMEPTASFRGMRDASTTYKLVIIREEAATEVPVRIQESYNAEMYRGKSLSLNLEEFFSGGESYYLTESSGNTAVDRNYTFTPETAGIYVLVFGAANQIGDCPESVTVTVTVKDIESGVWMGYAYGEGSVDSVVITDGDGNPIDGAKVTFEGTTIHVILPQTYGLTEKVTATFTRTANESGMPFLSSSNAFNQGTGSRTDVYTNTLSNGAAKRNVYLYNAVPKATNNSYVNFVLDYSIFNNLPVLAEGIAATAEATITAGQNYALDLTGLFTDADGDSMTYLVSIDGAAAVAAEAAYTYTTNTAGTYTLVFTANDGKGTSTAAYTVSLTVENSTVADSMTVFVPEGLEPKFYASAGFGADGIDLLGDVLTAEKGEGCYTVSYPANVERISFREETWGGMSFAAERDMSVTLRRVQMNVVDYDNDPAESTNTVAYDGHTAVSGTNGWLLLTGKEYTFNAVPKDTSLATVSMVEAVQPGEEIHRVNAVLGISNPIAITAPAGAAVRLYNYDTGKYYMATELDAKTVKENGDGTTTYSFVGDTKANGSCFIYQVSMSGKITKAGYLAWGEQTLNVTFSDSDKADTWRLEDYSGTNQENSGITEDSVLLNINSRNHLAMSVGESKTLKAYRAWEIIKLSYQNYIITPEFSYRILSGNDVVSLEDKDSNSAGEGDWKTLRAIGEGTAVIEVTFKAMEVTGGSYDGAYGSTDPARTGLLVVQVGGNDASVDFGIDCFASRGSAGSSNVAYNPNNKRAWDAEFDTLYFTGNSGVLKLSPTAGSAITEVAVSSNQGATWDALTEDAGVYTAPIVPGNNILRVTTTAGVSYQVVRGDKIAVQLSEQSGDGDGQYEPGETVRVTLKGLHMPIPKLAGNYNPGYYGNTDGYSSVHLNYSFDGNAVYGPGNQYNFITTANYLDITIPEDTTKNTLTLCDGYIGLGVMGLTAFDQGGDSHRNIPDSGCNTRGNQSTWHTRSILPEVTIPVSGIPVSVSGVSLDQTELTLNVGQTASLTATVVPADAENKKVTWTSGNAAVATAKDGVVTAVGEGTTTITVTTVDGEKTAACTVTVKAIPAETAEVYFSVSHDDQFLKAGNTVVALQKLTVPYFDLDLYGLGDFSLPKTNELYGKPTMLHLYLYATEVFRCGVAPEKAGMGYLKDQIGSDLFAYSGSPGSICIDKFWNMDMNLNYYHNYEFPADESGNGITADRVILEDGDIVTIGHFTSWKFFGDSSSIFNYLTADGDRIITSAAQNDVLSLQLYRAGADLGGGGSNIPVAAVRDIYYAQADSLASGDVTTWTKLGTTDAAGKLEADISELPVGQYILAVAGQKGVEYPSDIVSTPGGILLNVTANTLAPVVQNVIRMIKAIGEVSLEKESSIAAAREAYNALTDAEKSAVTNYAVLESAEKTLADRKQAAAVAEQIDAIGEVTEDSEAAILAARAAYDALTDAQKEYVDNLTTLTTAEEILAALKATQEDKEEAKKVSDLIEAIGSVTEDSEKDITEARNAYDALTDAQKAHVTNYEALLAAEEDFRLLKLSNADIAGIYRSTGSYLAGLEAPAVGTINGEWRVLGLARAGYRVPDAYYAAVVEYAAENMDSSGRLHSGKSSDNSRVILALTAIGKDVTDVGGKNLLSGLNEMSYIGNQGLNGYIWALLAFDSHAYPIPEGDVTKDALIQEILAAQHSDGGWALAGKVSDPDMTGMALAALAPYHSDSLVAAAIEKALACLSSMQNADGSFSSVTEGTTCESVAQVVTGLTALGIDPETDSRFVKNGVSALDALANFYVEGGGFRHGENGERNMMATEQGYYALVSYYRMLEKKTALYDMYDVVLETDAANRAAADAVIALINAIGQVDTTREAAIEAARAAYNALTDDQKQLVTNYEILTDAETALAELKQNAADTAAANRVKEQIDAIGTVTLNKENAIAAARSGYDTLTALQKNLVGAAYLKKLTDAEAELAALKKAAADEAAASAVEQKISSIGTNITLGSESKIQTARNGYNALTADQKKLVDNYQALVNAEAALKALKSTASVTFTLLGCYKHGTTETSVHTLAKGNLQTWIPAKTMKIAPGATVKDVFEEALTAAGLQWKNPTGNYVESIKYNGSWIGEFTNGTYSGWMYTLNGKHSNLGVAQQTLIDGDKIVFHYTDDYTAEEGSNGSTSSTTGSTTTSTTSTIYSTYTGTASNSAAAEAVDRLIEDIGEEITLDSEAKILAARASYDKLTEAQKKLVKNYDTLVEAEKKLAELKGTSSENVYLETGDYIQGLGTPGVGTVGGEWMVIGLARSGRNVPNGYYDHVLHYVRENINAEERLHSAKSSDNSRLILALTAIGKDVTNVEGHNLLNGLNSMDYIRKQGINGPIWALLAFDSGNYPVPDGDVSREKLIDVILNAQLSDGGWALSGEHSDPDMTGMAIQALARYMDSSADAKQAVEKAVWTLSGIQNDNGSFTSVDGPNCESIAQVIVALAALGIDADTDARFVKNGISALDALLTYCIPGGGFRHVLTGNLDGMATEQAYYALVAYNRMKQNQKFLYDMTDVIDAGGDVVTPESTQPMELPTEPVAEEPEEDKGKTVVIWTGVMTVCAAVIAVLLLNRKKLFGKFL